MRGRIGKIVAGAAAGAVMLAIAPAAQGAVINVNTTADEAGVNNSRCALREAIRSANNDAAVGGCSKGNGFDLVRMRQGVYRLTIAGMGDEDASLSGDLDLTDGVTLRPRLPLGRAIIDGGGIGRVMEISSPDPGVRLIGLTLRGGVSTGGGSNGGGIFLDNGAVARLVRTTVARNFTDGIGGGIASSGHLALLNSTVSGNRSEGQTGGISLGAPGSSFTSRNSTITRNVADSDDNGTGSGGGITRTIHLIDIDIRNTIIAGNVDRGGEAPNCEGQGMVAFPSSGFNLIGTTAGCKWTKAGGDQLNKQPRLGGLRLNGGPTATHALFRRSPAVNRGANAGCRRPDQRGVPRFRRCDIGAYERRLCRGIVVNRVGNPSGNVLKGTRRADGFLAFAGNDVLRGYRGPDAFCAGRGRDRIFGGPGNDRVLAQAGFDRIFGGPHHDAIFGGRHRDLMYGGRGNDLCNGDGGADFARGCERTRLVP